MGGMKRCLLRLGAAQDQRRADAIDRELIGAIERQAQA